MRRRLILLIVGVIAMTLLAAGGGTLVLANVRARATTQRELSTQAADIARNITAVLDIPADVETAAGAAQLRRRLNVLRQMAKIVNIDDIALLIETPQGALAGRDLPAGVGVDRLDLVALKALHGQSGTVGNLVFAAAPARVPDGRVVVVVLARKSNAGLGAAVRWFRFVAFGTIFAGLALAWWISRRLTRPIIDASEATKQIAAGNLSTRLPTPPPTRTDELAELWRNVNDMAVGLERSKDLEQQFLLSVSHDLRTPLTSIRGYAEAIGDGKADPVPAAAIITAEANRLDRLVTDLLDLAKLQARAFSLHPTAVDLQAAVTTAVMALTPDADQRGVRLTVSPGASATINADPDRLAQLIGNLIENALKYALSNVVVTVATIAGRGVLTVDDDGPGISADDLPHVFDRLYVSRQAVARRENSSGLGLAIVHELAEAMAGEVAASTAPAGGARISLTLPLVTAPRR